MSPERTGAAILLLGVFLLLSMTIRKRSDLLQRIFLPTSLIAGFLLFLLGPEVLGRIALAAGLGAFWEKGGVWGGMFGVWRELPGLLVNVIFAGLFLGKKIPPVKEIWKMSGPQFCYGMSVAFGHYAFGLLLAVLVLVPFFALPSVAGTLLEISFVGGSGMAAGLREDLRRTGFEDGEDMAAGLASLGILLGTIVCVCIVNWGARTNRFEVLAHPDELEEHESIGLKREHERERAGSLTVSSSVIEPMTLHLGAIGVAIFIGYLIQHGLILLETFLFGRSAGEALLSDVPLFPFAMVGSILMQLYADRFDEDRLIDRELVQRIRGLSLDYLIAATLATLSFGMIGSYFVPLLLLALTGLAWNLFMFLIMARRMMPHPWFERGISDLGQTLSFPPLGLLMLKIVDPDQETNAESSFGYKQLLYEPFVGGGLVTSFSLPLIYAFGPSVMLIVTFVLMLGFMALGLFHFGKDGR